MNYRCFDMGAYNLHIIKTKKFKTITMEVDFRRKINKDEITLRNLLKIVLLNSNKKFPTERKLIIETEKLYDLKLLSATYRLGNFSNVSFKTRFLDDKYASADNIEKSIRFLFDILFDPNIEDNKFNKEIVDSSKENLKKSIISLNDNKLKYALFKLLSSVDDKPYSYNTFGNIEDLDKIDESTLYEYYLSMLDNDYIDVFIVGDIDDEEKIKELFKTNFKIKKFHKNNRDLLVDELKPLKRIKKINEVGKYNQTQLTLLCTLTSLTDYERRYVIKLYNDILGGSSSSILFKNVREKHSYAYYINSIDKSYDNIMLIYSGIENGNEEKVLKLIKKALLDINKGKFDLEQLENSKNTIIGAIKSSIDSPIGIINTYYAKDLVNSDDIETRIDKLSKVTKEDIINLGKKVKLHTMFTLKGDNDENN